MRITDLIAIIAFPGIALNAIYIAYQIIGSFRAQVKHRIILRIVPPVSAAVLFLGSAVGLLFYNRLAYTTQGLATPQWVTDTISYLWFGLFLSLTGITWLYATNSTQKFIPIGKRKDDNNANPHA